MSIHYITAHILYIHYFAQNLKRNNNVQYFYLLISICQHHEIGVGINKKTTKTRLL